MSPREIDELVAIHVMGWDVELIDMSYKLPLLKKYGPKRADEWKPSEDIAAAWEVVEKFIPNFTLKALENSEGFEVYFGVPDDGMIYGAFARAETAPLAICLAALKAKSVIK